MTTFTKDPKSKKLVCDEDKNLVISRQTFDRLKRKENKSKNIEDSLNHLRKYIKEHHIESVAIPALGHGFASYSFEDLKERVYAILGDIDCEIMLYEPHE